MYTVHTCVTYDNVIWYRPVFPFAGPANLPQSFFHHQPTSVHHAIITVCQPIVDRRAAGAPGARGAAYSAGAWHMYTYVHMYICRPSSISIWCAPRSIDRARAPAAMALSYIIQIIMGRPINVAYNMHIYYYVREYWPAGGTRLDRINRAAGLRAWFYDYSRPWPAVA